MVEYFLVATSVFIFSIISFFSGFGLSTTLVPILILFQPPPIAITIAAILHFSNNVFKLCLLRTDVEKRAMLLFGIPAIFSGMLGALTLAYLSTIPTLFTSSIGGIEIRIEPIKFVIGALILIFISLEFFSLMPKKKPGKAFLPLGGLISGFFGGLSGHQGALRSGFLIHLGLNKNQYIATSAAIASCVDLFRISIYLVFFRTEIEAIPLPFLAMLLIAGMLGIYVGRSLLPRTRFELIRKFVMGLLLIIGLGLIFGVL